MAINKHPHLICTKAFRICEGLTLCESQYALAVRQGKDRYRIRYYTGTGPDRFFVEDETTLSFERALNLLDEWEGEMEKNGYSEASLHHFGSRYYQEVAKEFGLVPGLKKRSRQHAGRVKKMAQKKITRKKIVQKRSPRLS